MDRFEAFSMNNHGSYTRCRYSYALTSIIDCQKKCIFKRFFQGLTARTNNYLNLDFQKCFFFVAKTTRKTMAFLTFVQGSIVLKMVVLKYMTSIKDLHSFKRGFSMNIFLRINCLWIFDFKTFEAKPYFECEFSKIF